MRNKFKSSRLSGIGLSGIRVIWERTIGKPDVIRMDIGEPDFPPPRKIVQALHDAIESGFTHYSPSAGIQEVREAVAEKAKRENKIEADAADVVITPGGSAALFIALMATTNPGDEVLIPDPGWPQYGPMVRLADGVPVTYPLVEEEGYQIDLDGIRKKITAKTKTILINSPHNPTGAVIDRKKLEEIATLAVEHDLLVISDEVYEKFVFDGEAHISIGSLEGMQERVITVNSLSKTYAMTGLRLGYLIGPRYIVDEAVKLNLYTTTCANTAVQAAAVTALRHQHEEVREMVEEFKQRRDAVYSKLSEINDVECVRPKGSFYLFPNLRKAVSLNSFDLALYILDNVKVSTVPGSSFGENGEFHLRLSLTSKVEKLVEGIERIGMAIEKLKKQ